ncbi:MAG: hypothetical protein JEY79_16385 [Pseudodesulfovibrio sp.]|nr:hypothetical protein [Pseudodesulfovibrio sp.]
MKNRLILHIGLPKTGTTALQSFFALNSNALVSQGIKYVSNSHLAVNLWREGEDIKRSLSVWEDVRKITKAGKYDALVSNENLDSYLFEHPERIDDIRHSFSDADVKLVIYLRRQDIHLESYYLQTIRGNAITTPFGLDFIDNMLHQNYHNYEKKLRFFEKHFGADNIIVRLYDWKTFHSGNIFHDFLHAINVPWNDHYVHPPRSTNSSIDARMKDLLLTANATIPEAGNQLREFKELINVVEKFRFVDRETKLLTLQERKDFLAECKTGNDWVGQTYFGRDELFDCSNVEDLGEPKKISEQDMYMLMFFLNSAWIKGVGAVPFPVYNYLKIRHLKLKAAGITGAKKAVLFLRVGIHEILHLIKLYIIPTNWPSSHLEKTTMHYIWKNAKLWLGKTDNLIDKRTDD